VPIPKPDKADQFAFLWRTMAPLGATAPERNFRFVRGRKLNFDFAWASRKVAIEVDGGNWMVRQNKRTGQTIPVGRHTKDGDLKKCNLAAELGWRVLHYTPAMLDDDPQGVVLQVCRILAKR